jgi:drug/metabolite transporter (DMT)-like permease
VKKHQNLYAYIALVAAVIFWGISFVWTKELLNNNFHVIFIVTTRLIISFSLLAIIFKITNGLEKIQRQDLPKFLLLAFFEPFLYFIGENYGLNYVDASFAAIFIAIIPIVIPFGLYFFYREKLKWSIIVGVLISIIGIAIMSMSNGLSFDLSLKGVLLLLLAVFSAVGYNIVLYKLLKYSPVTITVYQNLISFFYYLPLFFIIDSNELFAMNWNFHTIFCFVMLSVFCSSIAFMGYSFAAQRITISKASVFTNAIPVITIIFAVIIGQETISFAKVLGMIVVISGVLLSQFIMRK